MADEGFPATVLLGFCVPCPKRALKLLSKIPPCVQKPHQAVWKGSYLLQMQRRQKPNTRNRPGKKKYETRTRMERSDKGANKETARKLAGNFRSGGTEDGKESRSDEKLGL